MKEKMKNAPEKSMFQEMGKDAPVYGAGHDGLSIRDITGHLSGPAISLVLHIALLAILGTMVLFEAPGPEKEDLVVQTVEVDVKELPPPPPEFQEPQEELFSDTPDVDMERPTVSTDIAKVDVGDVQIAGNAVETIEISVDTSIKMNNSALKMPGLYAARSGGGRLSAIKQYGGSVRTEQSVERALKWLASVQNEDGSWGDEEYHKIQLTCLALLTYLAHGETPQSAEYGDVLMKGLKKVVEWSESAYQYNGIIRGDWFAHARVCIVLAEGYAITKIPALERAMNKSVEKMVKSQNELGGWQSYWDRMKEVTVHTSNLDLGSRMYNALYSAFAAGCDVPGLEQAIDKALACMENVHNTADGGFSYGMSNGKGQGSFEATAAGTLYLYLMGGTDSKAAAKGLRWLENMKVCGKDGSELKMDWKNLPGKMSILGWYYMTQALFQGHKGSGKVWNKWNRSITTTLLKEQDPKGFWPCPADKYPVYEVIDGKRKEKIVAESSWGGFSELNGRIWATVYFTMTLEVYYCYLPTFKVKGEKTAMLEEFDDITL